MHHSKQEERRADFEPVGHQGRQHKHDVPNFEFAEILPGNILSDSPSRPFSKQYCKTVECKNNFIIRFFYAILAPGHVSSIKHSFVPKVSHPLRLRLSLRPRKSFAYAVSLSPSSSSHAFHPLSSLPPHFPICRVRW